MAELSLVRGGVRDEQRAHGAGELRLARGSPRVALVHTNGQGVRPRKPGRGGVRTKGAGLPGAPPHTREARRAAPVSRSRAPAPASSPR
ncbi:hypothetical protein VO63_28420 [Streptomyces showdoensis]|uniref:Uncharacterized protein n=1 Tax=Streptomyces showdoensis TaxID=68268 RepID=A0A2P2GIB4_STREW|nr:hypothetical protein VO63_28420 [Streptomyces showdoensis]